MTIGFSFHFNYQNVPLLFFFVSLMVLAGLIYKEGRTIGSSSIHFLSLLLLLFAFYLVPWMTGHAGWYGKDGYREFLFFVPFHQYFFFGPLMFFLTFSLTERDWKFTTKELGHLIPGILYLVYSAFIAGYDLLWVEEFVFYADGIDKDLKHWYQLTGMGSMLIYLCLCIHKYRNYKKRIYSELSYADSIRLKWLYTFLLAMLILILLRFTFTMLFPEEGKWGDRWWYYFIFGTLATYLGISGLINSIKIESLGKIGLLQKDEDTAEDLPIESVKMDISIPFQDLQNQMEQEAYFTDPALTLSQLSEKTGYNTSLLSKIINEGASLNFNDYINQFRIEKVKKAISSGELIYKTIEAVASEAGFNSRSTFQRAFKKYTGMTATEFLKSRQIP